MQTCTFYGPPYVYLDCKEDLHDIYDVNSGCWMEGLVDCACQQRLLDICPSKGKET